MMPAKPEDETWEWLQLREGWVQYEVLERVAICLESGVSQRTAQELAHRQVGAAGYSQRAKPWT